MAKLKVPETFRCHIKVQGVQCPCDLTMANTFTFSLPKLDDRAKRTDTVVDSKFLAAHAICPWHARYISKIQGGVVRMDGVASLLERRLVQARRSRAAKEEVVGRNQFLENRYLGRLPALAAALVEAGLSS